MNSTTTQAAIWATDPAHPIVADGSLENFEDTYVATSDFSAQQYAIMAVLAVPFVLSFHPKSTVRKVLYFLPMLLLIKAWFVPGKTSWDYQFGLLLTSWTWRVIDRLYFNDPEATFHRVGIDDKPGHGPSTYDPISKFIWALELIVVTRGIGWNWQVSSIPPHTTTKKGPFLLMKLRKAVLTYLGLHLSVQCSDFLLQLGAGTPPFPVPEMVQRVLLSTLFLHAFMYTSWAYMVYASLSLPENLFALFFVGLGVGGKWAQPEAWPSVFGPISKSYSFRSLWSKWWHQNCRRTCGTLGAFVVKKTPYLNKPQTKTAKYTRRYLQVLCVFVLSGIIHAGGSIYMATRDGNFNDGGNMMGFLYQAAIMIAEDLVYQHLGLGQDAGAPSLSRRLLGYAYVHGYALYAVPQLKVLKLAHDSGLVAAGGVYMPGVKMCGLGAHGIIKNPFTTLVGTLNN
ncbi:hypothetical protein K490DRAFT_59214 [Saccharata proteae CBS 121410]|uniref:Wax synthase domain-containing protein n=1 Tax=Saccharata proteae CBS 121410 TaxID=1314787 RepID=A0A9P4HNE9_9PEZI|nr:hypothetical protein K490DRAFT_59214 [Saccharata proteae CBS 121410]